ncbi:MAG: pilus assembly protein N-terminal domain-containing protein [Gemmatimonadota bacterium]|nr:MAG: pilus assembly protein N-terminal domain-containing protein [Gemmatimonadota bacterium]
MSGLARTLQRLDHPWPGLRVPPLPPLWALALVSALGAFAPVASAQVVQGETVTPVDMAIGRSIPMTTRQAIQRVSVANPEVADVLIIGEREMVVNALASGLTDLIIWQTDGQKFHFRVSVHSPTDRMQVILQVRFAEVSRDFLREIGASFLWRDQHTRVGTGNFSTRPATDEAGEPDIREAGQFATILSIGEVENLAGLLEIAEQEGHFRLLAEPNLIAANGEQATFLAGGEVPIPIAQPTSVGGLQSIAIQYREFGVRLSFEPEILSSELIKLRIEPEVSAIDFSNAIVTAGFEIPAFRTRRASTTVDLRQGQTLAIAGLLSSERQKLVTGVPFLKDIPLLGLLFSSQRWVNDETELLVLVQPLVIDPMNAPEPPAPPGEEDAEPDAESGGGK